MTLQNYYLFTGEKIRTRISSQDGNVDRLYHGALTIKNNNLESFQFGDGRIVWGDNNTPQFQYILRDHLGNTVVTFMDKDSDGMITENDSSPDSSEVISRHQYYAFGMEMDGVWKNESNDKVRYTYNGKEFVESGLDLLDYGARFYDPSIARFTTIDPLTEQFSHQSGYVYADNDPVGKIDWMGLSGEKVDDEYLKWLDVDGNWQEKRIGDAGGDEFDVINYGEINNDGTFTHHGTGVEQVQTVEGASAGNSEVDIHIRTAGKNTVHRSGASGAIQMAYPELIFMPLPKLGLLKVGNLFKSNSRLANSALSAIDDFTASYTISAPASFGIRAPKGGIIIRGKFYKGGQFIPRPKISYGRGGSGTYLQPPALSTGLRPTPTNFAVSPAIRYLMGIGVNSAVLSTAIYNSSKGKP